MRDPLLLYRQLGALKFWGFQVFFLSSLSQFMLAPLLWSFWLILFGVHPLQGLAPQGMIITGSILFFAVGVIDLLVSAYAIRRHGQMALLPWIVTLSAYFPMATIAAYKGFLELVFRPFFWDKTEHAQTKEGRTAQFSDVRV